METHDKSNDPLWGGYSRPGEPNSVHDCYFQRANNDPKVTQLWAYTGALSYTPGDRVELHVNTTSKTFDIELYRDGAEPQIIFKQQGVTGSFFRHQGIALFPGATGPLPLKSRLTRTGHQAAILSL